MNLLKFTALVFLGFQSSKIQAQAPRFVFLDSLSYNLSPVSDVVVRTQGYKRTVCIVTSGTKKPLDTVYLRSFFYNSEGKNSKTFHHPYKGDTLTISFDYDNLNRIVQSTGFSKNRRVFFSTSRYDNDSVIVQDHNYKGVPTLKKVMRYNERFQLAEFLTYDSTGKQLIHATYTYDEHYLPKRVIQTTGSRTDFDNLYQHDLGRKGRTVNIYEMFGGYKRLIEKIIYNSKGQLEKMISYDYYYKNKKFIAEFEYYDDGSLRSHKGFYPYSGYTVKHDYHHYKD